MSWRNRIVATGEQAASEFLASPHNWRIHPGRQQEAIDANLEALGWVAPVIVNRTTGHLVDGHARVNQALSHGEDTEVPYIVVELTEDEERAAIASLDPLSAMAIPDGEALAELVGDTELPPLIVSELSELIGEFGEIDSGSYETPKPKLSVTVECPDEDTALSVKEEMIARGYRAR